MTHSSLTLRTCGSCFSESTSPLVSHTGVGGKVGQRVARPNVEPGRRPRPRRRRRSARLLPCLRQHMRSPGSTRPRECGRAGFCHGGKRASAHDTERSHPSRGNTGYPPKSWDENTKRKGALCRRPFAVQSKVGGEKSERTVDCSMSEQWIAQGWHATRPFRILGVFRLHENGACCSTESENTCIETHVYQ